MALFQALYPGDPEGSGYLGVQCLPEALVVDDGGLPNCIVVTARFTPGTGDGGEAAACAPCDAPGLEPFASTVPVDEIGEGLAMYPCLCAVVPLPAGSACLPPDSDESYYSGVSWWCYGQPDDTDPQNNMCAPRPGPHLGFSPAALGSGTLYVACVEQPAP